MLKYLLIIIWIGESIVSHLLPTAVATPPSLQSQGNGANVSRRKRHRDRGKPFEGSEEGTM